MAPLAHVAHHADDRHPRLLRGSVAQLDPLADRILSRPVMRTTLSAPGRPSSALNPRPLTGVTPSTESSSVEVTIPPIRSGSSTPVSVKELSWKIAIDSNTCWRSRQSR